MMSAKVRPGTTHSAGLTTAPHQPFFPPRFMKLSATTTFAARLGLALVLVVVVVVMPTGGSRGF